MVETGQRRIDIRYLAGLIDGEGHIGFTETTNGNGVNPRLLVYNTYRPVIQALYDRWGGWLGEDTRRPKTCYTWSASSQPVMEKAINDLLPHLIIKQDKAQEVLRFISWRKTQGKHPDWSTYY